jgi:hypothetical protein
MKWLLYKWFSLTVGKKRITSQYFAHKLFGFVNSRGAWKKKYAFVRLVYCSDKYREIYGPEEYAELANRLFKEMDAEEEKSKRKINELMTKFSKT